MNTQKFENNLFELEVKTENGESLFVYWKGNKVG